MKNVERLEGVVNLIVSGGIRNGVDAAKAGAHVCTMPFGVLESLMKHPLTDIGLKKFLDESSELYAQVLFSQAEERLRAFIAAYHELLGQVMEAMIPNPDVRGA